MSKYDIVGEEYVADPRERRLRVLAQLIDKPLFMLCVAVAFAAAARGPGLLIPGYEPSAWFVLGLWILLSLAARILIIAALRRFRAAYAIPAPGADRNKGD